MKIKELTNVIAKIKDKKKKIAKERDELRTIYEELDNVIASFDEGVDLLEIGISEIEAAIDSISEVV